MKVGQTVAGALIDFVRAAEEDPHPVITLTGFLREWAADRGLDLDQANVAGWNKELGKEAGSPTYEERIRTRYGATR